MLRREVKLIDLEGLLERSQLELYQVPVVPVEDGDLALGVGDLADDSHRLDIGAPWQRLQQEKFQVPGSKEPPIYKKEDSKKTHMLLLIEVVYSFGIWNLALGTSRGAYLYGYVE